VCLSPGGESLRVQVRSLVGPFGVFSSIDHWTLLLLVSTVPLQLCLGDGNVATVQCTSTYLLELVSRSGQ